MALTARAIIHLVATHTKTLDLATPSLPLNADWTEAFTDGTGANSAEDLFTDQRTIAASGNEDLDLSGSLLNGHGDAITFTKIKMIAIKAADGNTNNVEVGPAASNGFLGPWKDASDRTVIKPGGMAIFVDPGADGFAVTAGTGDLINVANSGAGTGVTYDIIIWGETS